MEREEANTLIGDENNIGNSARDIAETVTGTDTKLITSVGSTSEAGYDPTVDAIGSRQFVVPRA